jgi:hypothetical protein
MTVPPEMLTRVEMAKKNKARAIQKRAEERKSAEAVAPETESAPTQEIIS